MYQYASWSHFLPWGFVKFVLHMCGGLWERCFTPYCMGLFPFANISFGYSHAFFSKEILNALPENEADA